VQENRIYQCCGKTGYTRRFEGARLVGRGFIPDSHKLPSNHCGLQPPAASALKGHDFSRAVNAANLSPALAAEGRFSRLRHSPAVRLLRSAPEGNARSYPRTNLTRSAAKGKCRPGKRTDKFSTPRRGERTYSPCAPVPPPRTPTPYFTCTIPATTSATFSSIWFQPSN
jgi:hypothetical protein